MKKLFLLFVTLLSLSILYLVGYKINAYLHPAEPFVYGLKSKAISKLSYLPEANSSILPIDPNTVALYTVKKNSFELEEIFRIAGIPYSKIEHILDAKNASILFLDLSMDHPVTLSRQERDFLYRFVEEGGTLIASDALNTRFGDLKALFGYRGFEPSKKRRFFFLLDSPYFHYFDTREERRYRLSGSTQAPWTNAIKLGSAKALALYDDKSAAISIHHYKKGKAILLGISLFDLRYRNLFGKDLQANEHYINHLEPLSDFITLFLLKPQLNTQIIRHDNIMGK